jgi:hypothetical protein
MIWSQRANATSKAQLAPNNWRMTGVLQAATRGTKAAHAPSPLITSVLYRPRTAEQVEKRAAQGNAWQTGNNVKFVRASRLVCESSRRSSDFRVTNDLHSPNPV